MDDEEEFRIERRENPRMAVASAARLRPNNWSAAEVDMVDFSSAGFRAAGDLLLRIGGYISLEIPGVGWVEARIVWQQHSEFGARFVTPVNPDHCAWLSRHARANGDVLSRALEARLATRFVPRESLAEPRREAGRK
jgi:hypothetical protein